MTDRTIFRLRDIVDAIDQIEKILDDKTFADVFSDRLLRAGYERFLEIISEASRHIPPEMKDGAPEIPWSDIAAIGNHLRHAYHRVDFEILWRIYDDGELHELRAAAKRFLQTHS
jgi:uncharacterized protein with HEPN domain